MQTAIFFKQKKHTLNTLFPHLNLKQKIKINYIKTLKKSKKYDLTFLDSSRYKQDDHIFLYFLSTNHFE